jgi:hypothetical protein
MTKRLAVHMSPAENKTMRNELEIMSSSTTLYLLCGRLGCITCMCLKLWRLTVYCKRKTLQIGNQAVSVSLEAVCVTLAVQASTSNSKTATRGLGPVSSDKFTRAVSTSIYQLLRIAPRLQWIYRLDLSIPKGTSLFHWSSILFNLELHPVYCCWLWSATIILQFFALLQKEIVEMETKQIREWEIRLW